MRFGKLLASTALLLLVTGTRPAVSAQGTPAKPPGEWRSAPFDLAQGKPFDFAQGKPEYVRLFAPVRAHAAAYRAYVSPLDLPAVLKLLAGEPSLLHPPGAWTPLALLPSDAFGQTGSYDRWKMAKLYGSRRAMVARGPRSEGVRPTEAWTLVSPYPDASLERLEPGTLLIVLDLPAE
jgi:hypothetical protein